jgi:hypothetical protein
VQQLARLHRVGAQTNPRRLIVKQMGRRHDPLRFLSLMNDESCSVSKRRTTRAVLTHEFSAGHTHNLTAGLDRSEGDNQTRQ